uniref:Uncharacterized protein n=1 Tax=Vitis vinifera TaxID=29760 RepID=A5AW56_VITVI|nr:hypothetical protein VITISV_036725 [Vitis vinifera]
MGVRRCEVALVCMKLTSGSDLNVSNGGAAATFPFMVCVLKDFKAWRFRSCEMSVQGCEMALVCQRVVSQLRNTLQNGSSAAKWRSSRRGGFAAAKRVYELAKWHSCAKGPLRSCENFHKGRLEAAKPFRSEGGNFRSGSLLLRNFAGHALSLLFELLLIPNFLLSTFLTFLLILIIQKPILHQNKLELKH